MRAIGRMQRQSGRGAWCSSSLRGSLDSRLHLSGPVHGAELTTISTRKRGEENESALVVSALLRGLAGPRSPDLHRNIYLNPNRASSLKHIELTDDSVRLVLTAPRMLVPAGG
jgi:hypothetical protein